MYLLRKYAVIALVILLLLINLSSMTTKSDTLSIKNSTDIKIEKEGESLGSTSNLVPQSNLVFTANLGQLDNDDVRFYDRGGSAWFTDDGVWLRLEGEEKGEGSLIVKQEFVGANDVRPEGREAVSWYSNFFYGNEPSKWRSYVPNYQEVYYENLYEGIDLRYYTSEAGLKYDFIIKPGADVEQIRLRYDGAERILIDDSGNLKVKCAGSDLTDKGLYIYQDHGDVRQEIEGLFVIYDEFEYGFELTGDYNKDLAFVIDPVLEFSTYAGGTKHDYGYGIAVDPSGSSYITGSTESSDFPNSTNANDTSYGGNSDAYILKLNPDGTSMVYSTFIGGSQEDNARSIEVNANGNAFITGYTESSNFPYTAGAYDTIYSGIQDAFVLQLNAAGSLLVYSTYIGGNSGEFCWSIQIDTVNNVYISGYTASNNFPTTSNAYDKIVNNTDAYVLKLNPTGSSIIYSTVFGGSGSDKSFDMAIDSAGNFYLTGWTNSVDLPVSQQAYDKTLGKLGDIFVVKFNSDLSKILFCTYLGTDTLNGEYGYGIDVDSDGCTYITGKTSVGFPTTPGAYSESYSGLLDCYVTKLNQTGSTLVYSTFIGGTDDDCGNAITVDEHGYAIVTGYTQSSDFPVTNDALNNSFLGGWRDTFVTILNENGTNLIYSTFIGGSEWDEGRALALDKYYNIHLAGFTSSLDYYTPPNSMNTTNHGFRDIFALKFGFSGIINIDSFDILLDNNSASNIYSEYKPYTFQVVVDDNFYFPDAETIQLILDPPGANIQLEWDRASGIFSEISDPNNYVSIDPSSSAENNGVNIWRINFSLVFNWTYPDELNHDVHIKLTDSLSKFQWFNVSSYYQVENDLVFNGSLVVKDQNGRLLVDNDLVGGGETLNFSGLWPKYQNSPDIFPSDDEFDIAISDESGNKWTVSPMSGQPFIFETTVGPLTNPSGENYTINLDGIPPECDLTDEIFTIRIDADNVTFSNPTPGSSLWHTNKVVLTGITITDIGGGLVNGSSVMYSVSKNNGNTWNDWVNVTGLGSDGTLTASDNVSFKEGTDNLIKWQAKDNLGNGPAKSMAHRIIVDTENVSYSAQLPLDSDVSTTELVQIGITVSDTTSGVNSSTIEYSVSDDKGITWGSWIPVNGLSNSHEVIISINHTFQNGTDNRLKWRAADIAGNGPTESSPYIINVNSWNAADKPKVNLISPVSGITLNVTEIDLSWELIDNNFTKITYDIYFSNTTPPEIYLNNYLQSNLKVTKLVHGDTYYWKVIPKAGGITGTCESGIWSFKVILPGEPLPGEYNYKVDINGPDHISLNPGESKIIELSVSNLGNVIDTIEFTIDAGDLPDGYIDFDDSQVIIVSEGSIKRSFSVDIPETANTGTFNVTITAASVSGGSSIKDDHIITIEIKKKVDGPGDTDVSDDKKDTGEKSNTMLLAVLAVIIVIIVIAVAAFIINKKKKSEPEVEQIQAPVEEAAVIEPVVTGAALPATEPAAIPTPAAAPEPIPVTAQPEQLPIDTATGETPAQLPALPPPEPAAAPETLQPEPAGVVAPTVPEELSQTPEQEPAVEPQESEPSENATVDTAAEQPIAGVTKPVPTKDDTETEPEATEDNEETN
jgi:hypothetical protein